MRTAMILLSLLWAATAAAQPAAPTEAADAGAGLPPLRICTGKTGNNYHRVGEAIASKLKGQVRVEVIETAGSWENLEAIHADRRRCDAIIAQDDAYALYEFEHPNTKFTMERITTLYPEYLHLLCNAEVEFDTFEPAKAARVKVLVNSYGSGTYITWSLLQRLNKAYEAVTSAEVSVDEGLLKITDGVGAQCMLFVSGKGGRTLRTADQRFGGRLKLVGLTDERLQRKVGRDKRVVYRPTTLEKGTYPHLQDAPVATQEVDAVFFASPEWKARHPEAAKKLATALVALLPAFREALE